MSQEELPEFGGLGIRAGKIESGGDAKVLAVGLFDQLDHFEGDLVG